MDPVFLGKPDPDPDPVKNRILSPQTDPYKSTFLYIPIYNVLQNTVSATTKISSLILSATSCLNQF